MDTFEGWFTVIYQSLDGGIRSGKDDECTGLRTYWMTNDDETHLIKRASDRLEVTTDGVHIACKAMRICERDSHGSYENIRNAVIVESSKQFFVVGMKRGMPHVRRAGLPKWMCWDTIDSRQLP